MGVKFLWYRPMSATMTDRLSLCLIFYLKKNNENIFVYFCSPRVAQNSSVSYRLRKVDLWTIYFYCSTFRTKASLAIMVSAILRIGTWVVRGLFLFWLYFWDWILYIWKKYLDDSLIWHQTSMISFKSNHSSRTLI